MLVTVALRCKMKNYLITVITISICIGVYHIISPHFRGIEKYSKIIGMLVVLCVVISPIKELAKAFDENGLQDLKDNILNTDDEIPNEYDEIFKEYLSAFSIEEIKREIKEIMAQEFDIPKEECEINVFTEKENEKLKISEVQILLSGKSIFKNPYTIEEYFENLLGCTCLVLIK